MTFPFRLPSDSEHELNAVREALQRFEVLRIALVFGSVARPEAGPQSDIDVAVLAHSPLSVEQHVAIIEALALRTGRPVDLVDLSRVG